MLSRDILVHFGLVCHNTSLNNRTVGIKCIFPPIVNACQTNVDPFPLPFYTYYSSRDILWSVVSN